MSIKLKNVQTFMRVMTMTSAAFPQNKMPVDFVEKLLWQFH